jgi:transcriptional regulator with XRE-family HTH domain
MLAGWYCRSRLRRCGLGVRAITAAEADVAARGNGSDGSLRARWLGKQLRQLRQARGLSLKHAAAIAGVQYADVRDFESGGQLLQLRQAARLLDLYQVHDPHEHDRLLRLARCAGPPSNGSPVPNGRSDDPAMLDWLWMEAQASRIRCHDLVLVPGLLQTPQYAAAANLPERRLSATHSLLENLTGGLHAVVDESVLRRLVGDADVLRHQLQHLAEAIRAPNVHIQVRVASAQIRGLSGTPKSFAVFDVPSPYTAVVAVTNGAGRPVVHEGGPARRYGAAFDQLAATALDPRASAELITSLAGQSP